MFFRYPHVLYLFFALGLIGCQTSPKPAPYQVEEIVERYSSIDAGLSVIDHFETTFGDKFYDCFSATSNEVQAQILSSLDSCIADTLEPLESFESLAHYEHTIDQLTHCYVADLLIHLQPRLQKAKRKSKLCININFAYKAIVSRTNPYSAYLDPQQETELTKLIQAAEKRKQKLFPNDNPSWEHVKIEELSARGIEFGATEEQIKAALGAPDRKVEHQNFRIWLYQRDLALIVADGVYLAVQKCNDCWKPRIRGSQVWMHSGLRDDQIIDSLQWDTMKREKKNSYK